MAGAPLLQVRRVSKTFRSPRPTQALKDLTLHVDEGEFVSIIGPSGCGKSTLFNLIVGVEAPSEGEIELAGETSPRRRRLLAAYLFQKDLLLPWRNVLDNAALGLEVAGVCSRREARARASSLLARFGLEGFERHHPAELSGGMRQRVALLRTLLLQRPLLLLDEPFASLDALTRLALQAWLRNTWRSGSRAALLVTHDVREAACLSDRVYVMSPRPGSIIAEIKLEQDNRDDPGRLAQVEQQLLEALRLPLENAMSGEGDAA
ncbi:MAG TPA: ABC transporter ATP-binding protein [Dehalococcoidia bacterium]|nr:ABC transporter ATP-binding protein [Dehalococcoidia bacterium]